jgi:hypothetical protein
MTHAARRDILTTARLLLVAWLMLVAYGDPIAQFFIDPPPQGVVHRLG